MSATHPTEEHLRDAPLRILHLVSSERWTGVAEPVVSLARQQQELGHEVWLACMPGGSFEERARMMGLRYAGNFYLDRRGVLKHLWDFVALRRFIRANRVGVLHCHLLNDHWLAALALRGIAPPPLLIRTFHRFAEPRADRLHRWLFREKTDLTIASSEELRLLLRDRLELHNGAIHTVLGAVNLRRFHPALAGGLQRARLKIPPDAPVAGLVARMSRQRGHLWLLDALPQVYTKIPQARVVLAGRGELKYTIRGRIQAEPHAGRTIMAGYIAEELAEIYAAFNVGLFLGQTSEGSSRSALEALATGLPVIGIRRGAMRHYIEDGVNGFLVEPDDREELARRLIELLGDLPRAREMGRKAREFAEQRFREIDRARKIIALYHAARERKTTRGE